jgi:hypothetical protein
VVRPHDEGDEEVSAASIATTGPSGHRSFGIQGPSGSAGATHPSCSAAWIRRATSRSQWRHRGRAGFGGEPVRTLVDVKKSVETKPNLPPGTLLRKLPSGRTVRGSPHRVPIRDRSGPESSSSWSHPSGFLRRELSTEGTASSSLLEDSLGNIPAGASDGVSRTLLREYPFGGAPGGDRGVLLATPSNDPLPSGVEPSTLEHLLRETDRGSSLGALSGISEPTSWSSPSGTLLTGVFRVLPSGAVQRVNFHGALLRESSTASFGSPLEIHRVASSFGSSPRRYPAGTCGWNVLRGLPAFGTRRAFGLERSVRHRRRSQQPSPRHPTPETSVPGRRRQHRATGARRKAAADTADI